MPNIENKPKPQPQYFTVKLEVMAPVELEFRILAIDAEEAFEKCRRGPLPPLAKNPKPILNRLRRVKATVYKFGRSTVELVKNL